MPRRDSAEKASRRESQENHARFSLPPVGTDEESRDDVILDITPIEPSGIIRKPQYSGGRSNMHRKSIVFDESNQPFRGGARRQSAWQKTQIVPGSADNRISVTRQFALLASGAESRLLLEDKMIRLPIFASCSSAFVHQLAQDSASRSYAAGQTIMREGCHGESLFLIITGTAHAWIEEHHVSTVNAGEWWGETNLLGLETQWTASLVAKDLCNVCEVTRDIFLKACYEWPDESQHFDELLRRNNMCKSDGTLQNTCEILTGLSDSTLLNIDAKMVRRLFFPGECFLEQGAPGDELYILVRGRADVEIAGRVVRQEWRGSLRHHEEALEMDTEHDGGHEGTAGTAGTAEPRESFLSFTRQRSMPTGEGETVEASAPVCFGELGLLGMQKVRSASVVAYSVCQVRVLYRSVFMKALEDHGESLQLQRMDAFLERRYDNSQMQPLQKLKEVQIFKEVGCGEAFLDFLAQHLEDRMYLAGQKIIDENNSEDRCMYILSSGSAKVLKGATEVSSLSSGAVFGEVVLLGLATKRSSTIIAKEVCYAQVLHQSVVIRGLEIFPEEREKMLMIAFKRTKPDDESSGMEGFPKTGEGWKANNLRAVIKAVKSSSLFGNISSDFIEELSTVSIDRIYMPGDVIIEEGQKGDSLFIMVSGQAAVFTAGIADAAGHKHAAVQPAHQEGSDANHREKSKKSMLAVPHGEPSKGRNHKRESMALRNLRIGMLTAGSISGELAMLGVSQTRSATIEAETICVMWEITNEKAMPIIEKYPDTRKDFLESICNHLEHTVSNCIDSLDLFKNFERKFRMLLGLYCERRAFFPGQTIFTEGAAGDGLYVLNLGEGDLQRKNISIKRVMSGSHFNSTIMLGYHKWCFCTLIATHTCHVVVVPRISYLQALEQYPSHQCHQDMARHEQAATEEFREAVRRLCTRGLIWNKSQVAVADAFQRLTEKVTDSEVLRRVMRTWSQHARKLARQRQTHNSRKRSTALWVQKQREAIMQRQIKDAETALVRERPISIEHVCDPLSPITPRAKVSKYTKLSSLYLHGPQDWESMFPLPKTPRQRQLWGLPEEISEEGLSRLPELIGTVKTPRDVRAMVTDGRPPAGGSNLPSFTANWEPPAPVWERSNDSFLNWDVAQMLCQ